MVPLPVVQIWREALSTIASRLRRLLLVAALPFGILAGWSTFLALSELEPKLSWNIVEAFVHALAGAMLAVGWQREVLLGSPQRRAPADDQWLWHRLHYVFWYLLLIVPTSFAYLILLTISFDSPWFIYLKRHWTLLAWGSWDSLYLLFAFVLARARLYLPSLAVDGPGVRQVWKLARGATTRIFVACVLPSWLLGKGLGPLLALLPGALATALSPVLMVSISIFGATTLALAFRHVVVMRAVRVLQD